MGAIKKLAGQTLIYGMGTIAPRVLNYLLLTPFYTDIFEKNEYGVVTELYAYVAFLMVILTYGMETTYFRFVEKESDKSKVFSTSSLALLFSSLTFLLLLFVFIDPISGWIKYENHPEYITMLGVILAFDAFLSIPFARLRHENRPMRFTVIKLVNVLVNIFLNILFFVIMPRMEAAGSSSFILTFYDPSMGVGYAFIANLIATLTSAVLLLPQILTIRLRFDTRMFREMLAYSWPLLIIGIAGMINEVSDKFVFKFLAEVPKGVDNPDDYIMSLIGVYGANTKLAVLMTLFTQMFRFAAEPFFFREAGKKNAPQTIAEVTKYFTVFGLIIFLLVMLYLDVFKHFINSRYHEGLFVVPIILGGNLFLGIFYNLSVWYKVKDLTRYGAVIALIGAAITILINVIFVPLFSYEASAWAHFITYLTMMVICYLWGQKHYPVPYPMKRLAVYTGLAIFLWIISLYLPDIESFGIKMTVHTLLFGIFLGFVFIRERKNILKGKQHA